MMGPIIRYQQKGTIGRIVEIENKREIFSKKDLFVPKVTKNVKDGKYKETNKETKEYSIGSYANKLREGIFITYTDQGKIKYEERYKNGLIQERKMYEDDLCDNELSFVEHRIYFEGHLIKRTINYRPDTRQVENFNTKGEYEGQFTETRNGNVVILFNIFDNCFVGSFYLEDGCLVSYEGGFDTNSRFSTPKASAIRWSSEDNVFSQFRRFLNEDRFLPHLNGFYKKTRSKNGAFLYDLYNDDTGIGTRLERGEKYVFIRYFDYGREISLKEYDTKAINIVMETAFRDVKVTEILNMINEYQGY